MKMLFEELKRRNVFRVSVAYLAGAWVLAQAAGFLVPAFELPIWTMRAWIVALAIGFPIVAVVTWMFELTPEGLKRTEDVPLEDSIRHITGTGAPASK